MYSSRLCKIITFILVIGLVITMFEPMVSNSYAKPSYPVYPGYPGYNPGGGDSEEDEDDTVIGELTTVETVDSISKGVTIHMFDYSSAANIGLGAYNNNSGEIQQGILNNKLASNGYPTIASGSQKGTNLSKWFSSTGSGVISSYENCNNLFLKSEYDSTGYYYYNCFENYAYLNQTKDTDTNSYSFTVYDQIGTPSNENLFYYKRGNFMPFNAISASRIASNKNYYDRFGNELASTDDRYGENLYLTSSNNYYFGMYMEANFNQLKDGKVNGEDMIFEFMGDDDLWIYIDDVLILDIGGIHDAHYGSINFATGEIIEDTSTQSIDSTNVTTIRERFEAALGVEEAAKYFVGDSNTFSDYSEHKMKMFYMERGAGASNCYIRFNMPIIPEGAIQVSKELEGESKCLYADKYFDFKMYVQKEISEGVYSDEYEVYIPQATDKLIDGDTEGTLTSEDGVFSLKTGQIAEFNGIAVNRKYYVEEVDADSNLYHNVTVNGVEVERIFTSDEDTTFDAQSSAETIDNRGLVVFTNFCKDIKGKIIINKEIDKLDLEDGDAIFNFKIEVLDKDENVTDTLYRAVRFDDESQLNKTIEITELPVGVYKVTEIQSVRYTCKSAIENTDTMTEDNEYTLEFDYLNEKTNERYYSDTDVVVNEFTIDEDGKLVVTQNKLKD